MKYCDKTVSYTLDNISSFITTLNQLNSATQHSLHVKGWT